MAETKKRLPVLKQTPEEEQGEAPRPPWHWVGFGTAATVAAWLPLLYLAGLLKQRLLDGRFAGLTSEQAVSDAVQALPAAEQSKMWLIVLGVPLVPFLAGAFFGGYIVGRWAGENAGVREAAIGGVAAALIVSVLAGGLSWVYLVLIAVSGAMAALGGKVGFARRIRALTPNMMTR